MKFNGGDEIDLRSVKFKDILANQTTSINLSMKIPIHLYYINTIPIHLYYINTYSMNARNCYKCDFFFAQEENSYIMRFNKRYWEE